MIQVRLLEKCNEHNANEALAALQNDGHQVADVQLKDGDILITYVAKPEDPAPVAKSGDK